MPRFIPNGAGLVGIGLMLAFGAGVLTGAKKAPGDVVARRILIVSDRGDTVGILGTFPGSRSGMLRLLDQAGAIRVAAIADPAGPEVMVNGPDSTVVQMHASRSGGAGLAVYGPSSSSVAFGYDPIRRGHAVTSIDADGRVAWRVP